MIAAAVRGRGYSAAMRLLTFVSGFVAGAAAASLVAYLAMQRGAVPSAPTPRPAVAGPHPDRVPPPPPLAPKEARPPGARAAATAARAPVVMPAEAPAVLPPLRLSAEHAEMIRPLPRENRPLTLSEQHQAFSLEDRDPEWAHRMEQALRAAADVVWPAPEFELSLIECRRTHCAVFAFGNLPDSGNRWNAGLNKISDGSSGAVPVGGVSTVMTERGGRTIIVTFIRRPPG